MGMAIKTSSCLPFLAFIHVDLRTCMERACVKCENLGNFGLGHDPFALREEWTQTNHLALIHVVNYLRRLTKESSRR